MLSVGYIQLKIDWDFPLECLVSRVRVQSCDLSNCRTTQLLGHLLSHQSCRPYKY